MRTNDGMQRLRIAIDAVAQLAAVAVTRLMTLFRGMPCLEAPEEALNLVRERFIGFIHTGKERVASRFWHFVQVQDTAHRRLLVRTDVRMPHLPARDRGRVLIRMDGDNLFITVG